MADPETVRVMPTAAYLAMEGREYVKGSVLDVGCGSKPYKRLFPDIEEWVGLDVRPVGEIQADAHDMPIEDEAFDTVICVDMLHLCLMPLLVVKECARVLKPDGFLIIAAPNCFAEDGESLWGIHIRALDLCISQAKLQGVHLGVNGRAWSQEYRDHARYEKTGIPTIPGTDGWLAQMDRRYPTVSVAIAHKDIEVKEKANGKEAEDGTRG